MATEFTIPLHRFDTNLLPPEARQVGTDAFRTAVMVHFAAEYAAQGQTAMVTVDDQEITVRAFPAEASALDFVMPMLKGGRIAEAVPYLESLTRSAPANAEVLYNLGIAYSELCQYDEAIIRLKRAVQLEPGHAHAWVGIGTAYHRMRKPEQALEAFGKAVEANPDDGYTRRNLGGMLIGFKRIGEAVMHLRRALDLMPDDPQAIFGLATALEQLGTREAAEEADGLYLRFIEEHPNSPMAEQAEKARTAFAQRRLKAASVGGFRPDVMMYISGALQTFRQQGPQTCRAIALEIAMLGRNGLDINDPDEKYTLKSLPGRFSGLHLLAIMYTAFRQIDPTMDTGADFAAEYTAALDLQPR
ncbi:MAG: tetratricopeptide repeat protein [Betaproteobacteria bacterium]|jgi:tetratricopeptide (TPR) repeat protein|nr:tetratricopeptide repeat protein [Betaproteobacteria bacterium]